MSAAPPWIAAQASQLLTQRGHAWLLAGPSGLGQYDLALALASAWLCERPSGEGACGQCGSCHAVAVRTHADLCVLMPETLMLTLAWPLGEKVQSELDSAKRKPSKEIKAEAMRDAIEFSQRTSARGRGKVVLVYPAERMNHVTANGLLKTLEEPSGDLKFVLASEAAHQLLPTVRSRCLWHAMAWPLAEQALAWLQGQGVPSAQASILLRAAGGRPQDALQFFQSGRDAAVWQALPAAVARGELAVFKDWSPAQVVDALHKLCHDKLAVLAGASPRFFDSAQLPKGSSLRALTDWSRALTATSRTVEHPYNAGLMLEALVSQARIALTTRA
jgi:DNA polymerase-3 subunit delta'